MGLNDLVQWICVAIVLVIVLVWIVKYVRGLVEWSKAVRKPGGKGAGEPPCCGGAKRKARHDECAGKCAAGHKHEKARQKGNPCAGCGEDCPLSGYGKTESRNQKL